MSAALAILAAIALVAGFERWWRGRRSDPEWFDVRMRDHLNETTPRLRRRRWL